MNRRRTWESEWDCPVDYDTCQSTVLIEYDVPTRHGGPEDFLPTVDVVTCGKGHVIPQQEVDRMMDCDWARFCADEADRMQGDYEAWCEHKWEVENDR